ncbi:MAG: type 1 glutamine amidotransferase family protein [Humidesulfovibrio sp.]|uniref:type 1 glutamine amidotransferase family protein n=1 Tax=Humidesulfovibrio sp. TaxID=2910988 RepID=UPI0027FCB3B8|nr:type 1 glutamine amidotransferase family protein [Humidesulfovibrio sp.]MDQ7834971.1 type 1 glutamine amidotransferase family protein [Humidesulfovibrio sp.]
MPGRTVYLYALDTMADWEPGLALAELNSGRFFRTGAPKLAVKTCALSAEPVTTMGGLRLLPDVAVDEIRPEDAALLLLPGGETWLEPLHAPAIAKAREFLSAGVPVAAICGATMALAQAGMLDTRPHTSNDLGFLKQMCPAYKGEPLYRAEPAVSAEGLITASGVAPLEFAARILTALDVFSEQTLAAWYNLHKHQEPRFFFELMHSLAPQ